jgi:threonine 3-dehydrogenase
MMITIKGICGREMPETWYAMSAMLRSGADISVVAARKAWLVPLVVFGTDR